MIIHRISVQTNAKKFMRQLKPRSCASKASNRLETMINKQKVVDYILLAIFLISLFSSLSLSLEDSSKFCLTPTSCDIVSTSSYASTFGIKNSYFGVIIFAILSLVAAWHIREPHHHKSKIIRTGVVVGATIAIYFLYLQIFVLKAFCTYCLIVDISLLVALALVLIHWRYGHRWKGS